MKERIQISVSPSVKQQVFAYAEAHNSSVSALFEQFVGSLDFEERRIKTFSQKYLGSISGDAINTEDILISALEEKHIHD